MTRVLVLCDDPKKEAREFHNKLKKKYILWENTRTEKNVAGVFSLFYTVYFTQEARGKNDKHFVDIVVDVKKEKIAYKEELYRTKKFKSVTTIEQVVHLIENVYI